MIIPGRKFASQFEAEGVANRVIKALNLDTDKLEYSIESGHGTRKFPYLNILEPMSPADNEEVCLWVVWITAGNDIVIGLKDWLEHDGIVYYRIDNSDDDNLIELGYE